MSSANGRSEGATLVADQVMMDDVEHDSEENNNCKQTTKHNKNFYGENLVISQNGSCKGHPLTPHDSQTKAQKKVLSKTDNEIVRIIGQHLRYLGFK